MIRSNLISVRIHSKVAYIDSKYAWLGSHNIRDEVFGKTRVVRNITLRQSGNATWQVGRYFELLWKEVNDEEISVVNYEEKASLAQKNLSLSRVVFRNSSLYRDSLKNVVFTAINESKKRCLIWTPYAFIPESIKTSIYTALKRGVDVQILLPSRTDYKFVNKAFVNNIKELIDNNIKVFVSKGTFDHSKALIIDDWVMLGSSNFDYRSLSINYEANFEIIDAKLADQLVSIFESRKSRQLDSSNYKISIVQRIISNIFNLPITIL